MTSTQIKNTEIFTFKAVAVFNLLNHKVLFTNRRLLLLKSRLLFKKTANIMGKLQQNYSFNVKFSGYL